MESDEPEPASRTTTDVKELVRKHWRRRAATFDDEPEHGIHSEAQHERWLSVLADWTDEPPRRTLDVGCGTGVVSMLLSELGHDVTGVDAAPEMLERARCKTSEVGLSIEFCLGDAMALGIDDDTFEHVVERHLLWTLPDPAGAIDEWRRVAEPGGRLVFFEGNWNFDEHRDEYAEIHDDLPMYHGKSASDLGNVLESAGLVDVETAPLMDPVLRGKEPEHDYFVVAGTNPA